MPPIRTGDPAPWKDKSRRRQNLKCNCFMCRKELSTLSSAAVSSLFLLQSSYTPKYGRKAACVSSRLSVLLFFSLVVLHHSSVPSCSTVFSLVPHGSEKRKETSFCLLPCAKQRSQMTAPPPKRACPCLFCNGHYPQASSRCLCIEAFLSFHLTAP